MYTTSRNMAGGTVTICKDCGHAVTMNQMCEKPIHSATDMLKHMAAHNASRAFVTAGRAIGPVPETVPSLELAPVLTEPPTLARFPQQ